MEISQKKVKSIILFCIFAVAILLIVSIALIVNINLAKNEINKQEKQIATLEKQIEYYNNLPSSDDQIIQGGNQ